ncbi:MAG: type II toxin-antitoxin system VapC family toxin [Bacteroidota bacterium]|jgi:predicted nucleic acid-binding protein
MKILLDTSSLFNLYHQETGTEELESVFLKSKVTHIYLSEISKVEFTSTIWKKARTKEISSEQAKITAELFESDFEKYNFISTDSLIIEQAKNLTTKYGLEGLRTLDSIQLSTCKVLEKQVDIFLTSDKLLNTLIEREGLITRMPNS